MNTMTWIRCIPTILAVSVVGAVMIPKMPDNLKKVCRVNQCNELVTLWERALDDMANFNSDEEIGGTPRTISTPSDLTLNNYVPMDAPSLFYSKKEVDRNLTAEILRDFFLEEAVDLDDEEVESETGLTVKNMNEKEMTFKKNVNGEVTVNNLPIQFAKKFDGNVTLIVYGGFIFNHRKKMSMGLRRLYREGAGFNPWITKPFGGQPSAPNNPP